MLNFQDIKTSDSVWRFVGQLVSIVIIGIILLELAEIFDVVKWK